jgi:hypothetical protein
MNVGCVSRTATETKVYRLDQGRGYPVLVPSLTPDQTAQDTRKTRVHLGGASDLPPSKQISCRATDPPFSLEPASGEGEWLLSSPTASYWEQLERQQDIKSLWMKFRDDIAYLSSDGCFGEKLATSEAVRAIVEHMALPAADLLYFYYCFSGTGFVDLVPGMQVRVERDLILRRNETEVMKPLEAQYEFVSASNDGGVTIRRTQSENRALTKKHGPETDVIFELAQAVGSARYLRLFLESESVGSANRRPILIAAENEKTMADASRKISEGAECDATRSADVRCIKFQPGVSLLIKLTLNGKQSYKPFGTTLGQVVPDSPKSIQTLSLRRHMRSGAYAEVIFPKTLDAALQLVLIDGDRLSWLH